MKKKVVCLMLIGTLLMLSVPMVAGAASCKKPAYNYMTLNFTGKRHNVKSRFTGIKVHSGKSVLNNKVTNTTSCFAKWRAADKDAGWQAATTTKEDTSTSSTSYAYTEPLVKYVTKGKASCKVRCYYCNSDQTTGTGEKSTSKRVPGKEYKFTL